MRWLIDWFGKWIVWLTLLMVFIGSGNAIARFAGKKLDMQLTSNLFVELQWYLFGVLFLLGGAYTLKENAHVRVDVLYDRFSKRRKAWLNFLGHVFLLLPFCIFGLAMSWNPVLDSWQRLELSPDPDGLPRYIIKTMIPLGFGLLLVQAFVEIRRCLQVLFSSGEEQ